MSVTRAISNDFNQLKQWQVQRVGYDLWGGGPGPIVQPPTLRNGSINGTAMTLLFSDALASVTPAGSAFNVKKAGLVERAMCVEDRRGIFVKLTPAGAERHAAAKATHRKVLADNLH